MRFESIVLLIVGPIFIFSGARIWIRKVTKFKDPFIGGPVPGDLICLVVRAIFGDAEIKGFAARVLGLFQMLLGLSVIAIVVTGELRASRYAQIQARKAARIAEATAAGSPREMTHLPAEQAGSPLSSLSSPALAAVPGAAPSAQPGAGVPTANQPGTPQPSASKKEKPGTIERMSKDWLPEGMQRR